MNAQTRILTLPTCAVAQFRDSNSRAPYNEPSTTFDLTATGRHGSARITAKVNGYWSTDVITIYVERDHRYDSKAEWRCTMSHSSGGRLTTPSDNYPAEHYTAVASDLEAESNFGAALIVLASFGASLSQHFDAMEEAYQAQRQLNDAKYEAEQAAKQALIDADAPLGLPAAKKLVAIARANLTKFNDVASIHTFTRGSDSCFPVTAKKTARITWYFLGNMMGEESLIAKLAEMSHRTCLFTEAA